MSPQPNKSAVFLVLCGVFLGLAAVFWLSDGGQGAKEASIPLVDTNFLDTATARRSYTDLERANEDRSDFDCYACHEKGKPPPLRFDTAQNIIVAKEHPDIVMGHGTHGRNNNCYSCHNENNLEMFQTRDSHELKFADSTKLCGSCHGPTYRDWNAGAHGRTSGYWNRDMGSVQRKDCVNCHNPHSPKFPGRKPAPGPHLLHPEVTASTETTPVH